jgi:hypothetical protein
VAAIEPDRLGAARASRDNGEEGLRGAQGPSAHLIAFFRGERQEVWINSDRHARHGDRRNRATSLTGYGSPGFLGQFPDRLPEQAIACGGLSARLYRE